ncbi:hypothetical protein [Leifsonia poae]|uniref:hypothetical protein n=1 Tax=Leifsonia poae TaxID=110933 RepID=UPI003D67366B
MTESESSLDDLRMPENWHVAWVRAGWSGYSLELIAKLPIEQVGIYQLPRLFEMWIAEGGTQVMICVQFWAADGELSLASTHSVGLDVDETVNRLKALRSFPWWKRKAVQQMDYYNISADNIISTSTRPEGMSRSEWDSIISADPALAARVRTVPTTRRRDRITDALLKEVADVYRKAWEDGENPTQSVQKHFYKAYSTSARWVGLARERGFLGPADGSKGGELNDVTAEQP